MLSGIKTGKKKKKSSSISERRNDDVASSPMSFAKKAPPAAAAAAVGVAKASPPITSASSDNLSVAEQLKQALATGKPLGGFVTKHTSSSSSPLSSTLSRLEASGRITVDHAQAAVANTNDLSSGVMVLPQKSHLPTQYDAHKREVDMSVTELAARERAGALGGGGTAYNNDMSWDEAMARSVVRTGKKRKMKLKSMQQHRDGDSDEEVERAKRHLPGYEEDDIGDDDKPRSLSAKLQRREEQQREKEAQRTRRRQIDQFQKQDAMVSKFAWWVQSSNFAKHRLIAFGQHVSLIMAPLQSSLVPGHHFYLVPIKHSPSLVDGGGGEAGIWEEVNLFRQALENVYARDRKGIVMCETVLPSNNNSNTGFWQTKLEVVPVPFAVLQDAPLYFKSAMMEQAEEWGAHNKVLPTSAQKPLQAVIPSGFPYFAVNWGNLATSRNANGYAQIIESSSFRHDFGLDTLAAMMEMDPVRFHRKRTFPKDMERQLMEVFLEKWKPFDWTEKLAEA